MSATSYPKSHVHVVAVYEAAARGTRASWEGPTAPASRPPPAPPSRPRPPPPPTSFGRKSRTARNEATELTPRPSFASSESSAPTYPVVPAPHLLPSRFMNAPRARMYRADAAEPAQRDPSRWLQLGVAAGVMMMFGAFAVALFQPKAPPPAEVTRCVETAPAITPAALTPSTTPLAAPARSKPPARAESLPAVKSLAAHAVDPPAAARRLPEPTRATRPARPSAPGPHPARARPTVARARPAKKKRPASQEAAPAPQMPSWTSLGSRADTRW